MGEQRRSVGGTENKEVAGFDVSALAESNLFLFFILFWYPFWCLILIQLNVVVLSLLFDLSSPYVLILLCWRRISVKSLFEKFVFVGFQILVLTELYLYVFCSVLADTFHLFHVEIGTVFEKKQVRQFVSKNNIFFCCLLFCLYMGLGKLFTVKCFFSLSYLCRALPNHTRIFGHMKHRLYCFYLFSLNSFTFNFLRLTGFCLDLF